SCLYYSTSTLIHPSSLLSLQRPTSPPHLPYTPHFRSVGHVLPIGGEALHRLGSLIDRDAQGAGDVAGEKGLAGPGDQAAEAVKRSEEHTSELQSRGHLVCRLLLDKNKKQMTVHISRCV